MSTEIKNLFQPTVPKPVEEFSQINSTHDMDNQLIVGKMEQVLDNTLKEIKGEQQSLSSHSKDQIKVYIYYDYSPKSFLVYGEDNDKYKNYFIEAGGSYKPRYSLEKIGKGFVPGWCFSNKRREQVEEIYKNILSGEIDPIDPGPKTYSKRSGTSKGSKSLSLITNGIQNQTFTYTVVKPKIGIKATIKMKSCSHIVTVFDIPCSHHNTVVNVGRVRVSLDSDPNIIYTLGIINGEWQILGTLDQHEVIFNI